MSLLALLSALGGAGGGTSGFNPDLLVSKGGQGGAGGGPNMTSVTNTAFTPGGSTFTYNMGSGGQDSSSLLAMLAALGGMGQTKQQQKAPDIALDQDYVKKYMGGKVPVGYTTTLPSQVAGTGAYGTVSSYPGAGPGSGGLDANLGSPGGRAIGSGGRTA